MWRAGSQACYATTMWIAGRGTPRMAFSAGVGVGLQTKHAQGGQ
jgi:hypothetical protein